MRRLVSAWRNPVVMQVVFVIGASVVLGTVMLFTLTWIDGNVGTASDNSQAAILASRIDHSIELVIHMLHEEDDRLASEPDKTLPAETALRIADELHFQQNAAREFSWLSPGGGSPDLSGHVDREIAAFRAYAKDHLPESLAAMRVALGDSNAAVERVAPIYAAAARTDQADVRRVVAWARVGLLACVAVGTIVLGGMTLFVSRRMNAALRSSRAERAELVHTTQVMERRNGQFRALYQIVTEVSETLSMKYVVETTIREARKLVSADVTVLRLLQGDWLEVAGSSADVEADAAGLGPIQLGSGVSGRSAKRGRSVLIHEDAEASMAPGEMVLGMQSGVVVPLIVGARVVGTMSCWSRQPDMFSEDDQQVLEMMGSQVATAVAAADSHRATEQLAHTDTLTDLANRRQLAKDTTERFQPALAAGRTLAVAMIDIDHFKRFNDEFGHKTGDITLQKVASVLRAALREDDFVYRYGGEEFTVVVQDATGEQALHQLERVRATVERTPLTGESGQPVGPVTVSIGMASSPDGPADFEALLKFADMALYESKGEGRNRVTAYSNALEAVPEAA